MYSFKNDYSEMAHKNIIELMLKSLTEQNDGYGLDQHSQHASLLIKKLIKNDVDIHFLVGGTNANKTIISHALKPYEAVISVQSGHINVHETGAIESSGHKILLVKGINGKITKNDIIQVYKENNNEHMVIPKMVYISNATEFGTIYRKDELTEISNICKELDLFLFIDGARLGAALTSNANDLTLNDLSYLADVFYIGGTKNGALLGEAVVISNNLLKQSFRHSIKLNGGMLAKGFLVGIQFEALFTDDLFFKLAKNANDLANILKNGLKSLRVPFLLDSPTNQQFIILDNEVVDELSNSYEFEIWENSKDSTTIRLVTSWATDIIRVEKFLLDLSNILNYKKV